MSIGKSSAYWIDATPNCPAHSASALSPLTSAKAICVLNVAS